jgi:succinate dehydrogenase/fumarate reductase flavoprotein subunit
VLHLLRASTSGAHQSAQHEELWASSKLNAGKPYNHRRQRRARRPSTPTKAAPQGSGPKSNWANTIEEPPFEAYAVTCGITFTFGGVKIDTDARVVSTEGEPIPGLYAAGEMVGGLFYFNYPGGTGLMNGAVFGRIAGNTAGKNARRNA